MILGVFENSDLKIIHGAWSFNKVRGIMACLNNL